MGPHDLSPAPGGFYPVDATDHEIVPQQGTCFSAAGMNTGLPANLQNSLHYPVEALCDICGEVIEAVHFYRDWTHTGRQPGDPR